MENTPSVSSDAPVSAPSSSQSSPHKRLKGLIFGVIGVFVLGGGVAAYFVTTSMLNAAAGIPIPTFEGTLAFRVPEDSLMANASYTRDDGQIVHYIDKPSVIERAWTEKNHHILIKFTDAFGLVGEVDPEEVILGRAFTTYCQSDVTNVKDAWYYVYTSPKFEQEKEGSFPIERFLLGNCRDGLKPFEDRYTGKPRIRAGDLVYVAIPPVEVEKIESAEQGAIQLRSLHAATSADTDKDGLLDFVEQGFGSDEHNFDSDFDGVGDGLEVAGGEYAVPIAGTSAVRHLAAHAVDWSNADSDQDGLSDATELGMISSQNVKPEESTLFVADADPLTMTNPGAPDTDEGGKTDGEEDLNRNGRVDEGETDPNNREDDFAPPLPPPLASGLNITALKFDADGTEPGQGVFDAATFRFSFTPEATSGLQKAELRDIFFFVKSFNIEMAANGFVLYNKHVNSDIRSRCLPLRDGVPFDTGVVSGTFLVECRDVPVSGVPAMITPNSNQDFVFRMTINNKQVTSTLEYGLQVSLDQFTDSSKTAFGHNQSHVHWTGSGSETQGTVTEFFFAHGEDPLRSTLYGSFSSAICGNGTKEGTEECDDGNQIDTDSCSNACKNNTAAPLTCGNGTLDDGETCDDSNVVSGDGCSALCTTESGYTCTGAPSVCTANAVCGNGIKEGTEECDEDTPICTADCKKIQFPEL